MILFCFNSQALAQTASYAPVPAREPGAGRIMRPIPVGYDFVVKPGFQLGLTGRRLDSQGEEEGEDEDDGRGKGGGAGGKSSALEARQKQLADMAKQLKGSTGRFFKGPSLNAHKG